MPTHTINASPQTSALFVQGGNQDDVVLINVGTTVIYVDSATSVDKNSQPILPGGVAEWKAGKPLNAVSAGPGQGRLLVNPAGGFSLNPSQPFAGFVDLGISGPYTATGGGQAALPVCYVGVFQQVRIDTFPTGAATDWTVEVAFYDSYDSASGTFGAQVSFNTYEMQAEAFITVPVDGPYMQVAIIGNVDSVFQAIVRATAVKRRAGVIAYALAQGGEYTAIASAAPATRGNVLTLPPCSGPTQFSFLVTASTVTHLGILFPDGGSYWILSTGDTPLAVGSTKQVTISLPVGVCTLQAASPANAIVRVSMVPVDALN